jgi:uncharacterized protein YndB with AHSA1/START domain
MPTLYTEILIEAPRQAVWEALVYKDRWRFWNTFLYDCSPRAGFVPGKEILLAVRRVPGDEPIEFRAKVRQVMDGYGVQWKASIPGFSSDVSIELQEVGQGRTKYLHQEKVSGAIGRFALSFIRDDQMRGMRRMAQELKLYSEGL